MLLYTFVLLGSFQVLLANAQSCTGTLKSELDTGLLEGCSNKCIYQINNDTLWKPENPIDITVENGPVYFSSLTCPEDKKNVEMTIDSEEDDFDVCVAPVTAGTCFDRDNRVDDMKCFRTGGMLSGNDGIMKDIGAGTWVFSVQHKDGNTDMITLESIKFSCTDKEAPWWMQYIYYAAGGAAFLFLCCCWYCFGCSTVYDTICCCFTCVTGEDGEEQAKSGCADCICSLI